MTLYWVTGYNGKGSWRTNSFTTRAAADAYVAELQAEGYKVGVQVSHV